jgi:hypothetical protein
MSPTSVMTNPGLRVLHCPTNVGNNPSQLARTERRLGLNSLSIAFSDNPLTLPADQTLLKPGASLLTGEMHRYRLIWQAIREFDIIHFNFGQTITPLQFTGRTRHKQVPPAVLWLYSLYTNLVSMKELPLLKKRGKGIFVTFQGSDARQDDYCARYFTITPARTPGYQTAPPWLDGIKRARIATWERYADCIYALNPDLLHVLPARAMFMPYATVDLDEWQPAIAQRELTTPQRVLHAPSHRGLKGTQWVIEAVNRLQSDDHLPVELILVEGIPRSQVRALYEQADLLVDQLLIGWYGGLAVELMALGKPVICYIRPEDLKFIPPEMAASLPIIQATPSSVYQVLYECLTTRRHELPEIGRQSRLFAEAWHDPTIIAGNLKEAYQSVWIEKGHAH